MNDPITIDGSAGEGGGQVLRSALSLSLVAGRPFRIEKIRAGRKRPGLARQHLMAVHAAAEVGRAEVEGDRLGSQVLTFHPGRVQSGDYAFRIASAGSATLVVQTVLPPLLAAEGPSQLKLEGGTHNPWAPPVDFLDKVFVPLLKRMGPAVEVTLKRHGFYPAGGGLFEVDVRPSPEPRPIELTERGRIVRRHVSAVVSRLPLSIAEREVQTVRRKLGWGEDCASLREVESAGPGNAVMIEIECEQVTEVFVGFGQRGVPAERVAAGAAREAQRYLDAGVPVGDHLADQLLLPMALAGGGRFRTLRPTPHTETNLEVIRRFLDVKITVEPLGPEDWLVTVGG